MALRARHWTLAAFAAFAFAAAYPMQVNGWNQNAHYALVRALAQGTPTIDRTRHEIGDLGTGDVTLVDGHYYSNKAPGLAIATVPALMLVDALGMRTTGDPTRVIWALHLWSIALPALVLLLLVRAFADEGAPGTGTVAAATLGFATLVLPFATLFFSHVLAAALAFAAFFVVERQRRRSGPRWHAAVGGALAGYGVVTEYTVALVALALWLVVLSGPDRLGRAATYAAGLAAGVTPLALYNVWAFGSPTELSYEENQVEPIGGFFGVGLPSAQAAFDLLFSAWGLVTNTPVLVLGLVGGVLLYRRGRRVAALVLLAIPAVAFVHDAALQFSPFGGLGLPRYLIYVLPFVVAPIGLAYRRLPLTTTALAVVSACQMVLTTATNPLAAYDLDWMTRIANRQFSQTGAALVGVTGWYTIVAFFAAAALGILAGALATSWARIERRDAAVAVAALAVWVLVASLARTPDGARLETGYVLAVACAATLAALALTLRLRSLRVRAQPLPG